MGPFPTVIAAAAGTLATVLITGTVILLAVAWAVRSIQGHGTKGEPTTRCENCGGRLRARDGRPMPVCRKCGTRQSWASRG